MTQLRSHCISLVLFLCGLSIVGCTTGPVDPATASKIKSFTVTRLELPEYSYVGIDGEAAAKSAGVLVGYAAFGVLGFAAADAIKAKSEQPHRNAIRDALANHGPSFEQTLNQRVEAELKLRGASVTFIAPPPRMPDNSGYDFGNADFSSDAVLELYPLMVGFSYQNQQAAPIVDIRWRILVRYPNGQLIETNRGSVVHRNTKSVIGQIGEAIPSNSAYLFKGHVTDLKSHGDKPHQVMQELALRVSGMIVERAYPLPVTFK